METKRIEVQPPTTALGALKIQQKELTYLSSINSHPRDNDIRHETRTSQPKTPDEEPRTYHVMTVRGDAFYKSVTSYIPSLFPEFDADKVIDKMMASPKWPQSQYYGMTKEEIKTLWENKGKASASDGTDIHYCIESYYNNEPVVDVDNNPVDLSSFDEYQQFLKFAEDYKHLKPYRTEWAVYDEDIKMKGIIDMIFENEDGTLSVYDWKRVKELKKDNKWESAFDPIDHVPNEKYWHYAIQLNIYKHILETHYDKKVKEMYLVCLFPNQESYKRIKVIDMREEIKALFKERLQYLKDVEERKRVREAEKETKRMLEQEQTPQSQQPDTVTETETKEPEPQKRSYNTRSKTKKNQVVPMLDLDLSNVVVEEAMPTPIKRPRETKTKTKTTTKPKQQRNSRKRKPINEVVIALDTTDEE